MKEVKYPLHSFLTAGDLKRLLVNVADDCIITARDRDCISLDQVHAVNITIIEDLRAHRTFNGDADNKDGISFVENIEDVYGGEEMVLENPSGQAIIFCDND